VSGTPHGGEPLQECGDAIERGGVTVRAAVSSTPVARVGHRHLDLSRIAVTNLRDLGSAERAKVIAGAMFWSPPPLGGLGQYL
jgi:hypothetical protein